MPKCGDCRYAGTLRAPKTIACTNPKSKHKVAMPTDFTWCDEFRHPTRWYILNEQVAAIDEGDHYYMRATNGCAFRVANRSDLLRLFKEVEVEDEKHEPAHEPKPKRYRLKEPATLSEWGDGTFNVMVGDECLQNMSQFAVDRFFVEVTEDADSL